MLAAVNMQADVVKDYGYQGMTFSYDTETHKATLTDGKSTSLSNLSIPATIMVSNDSYSVIAIGEAAFQNNTSIVQVTIPEGVETIGASAFQGCSQIKMMTLPKTLGDNGGTIGSNAFKDCSRLVYVGWGQTDPDKFGPSCFPENKLMTLYVPDGYKNGYLDVNSKWQTDSKKRFENRIYEGNIRVLSSDGMTYVCADGSGKEAILIESKNNVSEVTVPGTFYENEISYNVKSIGRSVFNGNTSLNTVIIDNGVTTINNMAFQGCSNLKKLTLPSTLTFIADDAFKDCSSLIHIRCQVNGSTSLHPTFPTKDMMTLYVDNANDYRTNNDWNSLFNGRIYEGNMEEVAFGGMTYICATASKVATLFVGKNDEDVVVPSTISDGNDDYIVTGIDRQAFCGFSSVVNLTVSENITIIGPDAFKSCSSLKTAKLPASLTSIKSKAFDGCSNLARVVCKAQPFSISDNVFSSAKSLYVPTSSRESYRTADGWKKFEFIMGGEAVEIKYENMGFICATGTKEAILIQGDKTASDVLIPTFVPSGDVYYDVIAIDKEAFSGATSLVTLTFDSYGGNNLSIGEKAFSGCTKLRMLTFPTHLTKIGNQAFSSCNSLVHIICKSTNPFNIDTNVFTNTTTQKATLYVPTGYANDYRSRTGWANFTSIVECDDMEELGDGGMTYVCLKKGKSLTATLTKGISSVSDVVIPSSVTSTRGTYNVVAIDKSAFSGFKTLANLTLSEGIKTIGSNAFQNCTGLKKLLLPSSLTSIGDLAFNGCNNLTNIESKISNLFAITSTVFSNTSATLYVPAGMTGTYKETSGWSNFANMVEGDRVEVTHDNITYVYASGGTTATLIKSNSTDAVLVIPSVVPGTTMKVTTIDKSAFNSNSSLVNLTIPEGVVTIGMYAFQKCSNLKTVVLPSTLTSIGDYAFDQCKKIETMTSGIPTAKLFVISENVFSSEIWPTTAVYVPIGAASTYKAKDGWKKFTNYYEGERSQITINQLTYDYLTGAKTATLIGTTSEDNDVTIPGTFLIGEDTYTVTAIANSAFKGKTSLVNLKISGNVKTIGTYAFQGCSNLKKIEFPSTLTGIGEKAFDGCKNITHICSLVKVPFEFLLNVFSSYTATLYVPEGAKDNYKSTNYWSQFSNVVEGYLVNEIISEDLTFDLMSTGSGETLKETAILTKSATTTPTVNIPSTIDRFKVTMIGPSSFSGNSKLVNLIIPANVQTIGDNAFNGCNNIVNIISKIENPTDISDNVFSTSSASLYVPKGTRDLYKSKNGWSRFTTVYEGEMGEKTVGDLSFVYATADKTAMLVGTTTTATDVVVPDSFAVNDVYYYVTAIDKSVFKGKTSIVNLTLPSKLTQIGDDAFNGCKNIATITCKAIEPPVITDNVFPAYTATLYVPEGSRSKYQGATGWKNFATVFEGVWKEVTLEDGMTFVYATGDKTATLTKTTSSENDVTIRGSFAIDGVTYKVTTIDNSVFKGNTSIASLKISENIKSIGAYAFQGCTNLKRVELPSTLVNLGEKAFDGDKKLVHVCSKIKEPLDINENVFSNHTAALYVPDGTLSSYQTRSGWNLFANFYQGYFVDELISDGMTFICLKNGEGKTTTTKAILTKASVSSSYVSIPASLQLGKESYKVTTIGNSAFNNSSKLVNLTLSENISSIEDNAFANCLNISVVTSMIKEPVGFNDNVFSAYTATLYVPEGTRTKYQAAKGWKNFATILEGERNETTTEDGMTYIYATGDKTATLVKVASVDKDFIVRGSFKIGEITYKVTAIDKSVFKDKKSIVSLKIEENIKTIGANAFQNCVNLEKIELPSTMTEIGECAFDNCTRLSHVVSRVKSPFPINGNVFAESIYPTAKLYVPTVTSADYKTTAGWENFKTILVGDMKVVIQDDITYYCVQGPNIATLVKASTSAAEVTIPASVKDGEITYNVADVGAYAFSGIGSLKKLTISKGVKSIGTGAFQNCSNLEKVVLPASLSSIDDYAFDKCNRLTLVMSDGESPVEISDNVFSSYTAKLNVPVGSADLYRNADGWKQFSTILEGDMLEAEVDGMTYTYVTGPRTATLTKGVTEETDLTIQATVTIRGVEYTVTEIGESAFANTSSIVNLTISGGIESIGANAFRNCAYLTKVELPSSLTYIGSGAFSKCDRLSHVVSFIMDPFQISDDVFTAMAYSNGTLYVPVKTGKLYKDASGWSNFLSVLEGEMYEATLDGMTYTYIPNLKIAKLTKGISDAKDVTIPSSISIDGISYQVTDIERSAFYGINSLVNLTVSEGIKTIGYTAFKNCYNLKTVSLPSSLVSIGDYAFENCKKITTIRCQGEKPIAISDKVFSSSSMDLYVPAGAASLYQADSNWGQFNIKASAAITISTAQQLAYYSDQALDFSDYPDLKAYVATGYAKSGTIWLTRVKQVPANTGFLLMGDPGEYELPVIVGDCSAYYKNLFKGTLEGTTIQTTEDGYTNYYLSDGDYGVSFYKVGASGVKLGANRAYLSVPSNIPAVGTAGGTETIKVSAALQVPYYSANSLDFTDMESKGLKAYTATGYDYAKGTIWLSRVKQVPAETGILIMADKAGDYDVPKASVASVYENMFMGTLGGKTIQTEETIAGEDYINYYLSKGDYGISFYKVGASGVTLGENRCYLAVPVRKSSASGTRSFSSEADQITIQESDEVIGIPLYRGIESDEDGTTGVKEVKSGEVKSDEWFTLQGQRVAKPGKGLYIKNGKKVIVR